MVLRRERFLAAAIILALSSLGCGVYSFSGSMRSGMKSIAVPVFENKSVEYGIAEELTAGVVDRFVSDNTLKVVPRAKADVVLEATIQSYERVAYTYDENDQVQEYKVNISVAARLAKSDGEVVWEDGSLTAFGIYKADAETEDEGKSRAIEKIAEDMVNRTVRDW
jgi:outer membrane lipopolysaccharide assembly protein LptE/RlpB